MIIAWTPHSAFVGWPQSTLQTALNEASGSQSSVEASTYYQHPSSAETKAQWGSLVHQWLVILQLLLGGEERSLQSICQVPCLCQWNGGQWPAWVTSVFCWQLVANLTQSPPSLWFTHLSLSPARAGWLSASYLAETWKIRASCSQSKLGWTLLRRQYLICDGLMRLVTLLSTAVFSWPRCSTDSLFAAALSFGVDGKGSERNRGEGACVCLGGAAALCSSSFCWPSAGSCGYTPLPAGPPRWERGKISSFCISCQGCAVD